MAIKKLDKPFDFLMDCGLLYKINLEVLHPFGLAMEVKLNDDGTKEFGGIWDYLDDPDGLTFDDETMAHGAEKFNTFMEVFGTDKLKQRMENLGFIIQPIQEEEKKPKRIYKARTKKK